MKTYKQSEWTEIVNKSRGGRIWISGVNLARDLTVESLSTTTALSGGLSAWGEISPSGITEIGGRKQFVFVPGEGVDLVVDADETFRFKPVVPCELENPKTIPFSKWIADYVKANNLINKRDEDRIDRIEVVGCELNAKGIVRALNARVTWRPTYGPFGRLTTDRHLEITRDILWGTYMMERHNDIEDDWTPNCCGDHGYRAYFNDGFDVVYADDGRYSICGELGRCWDYIKSHPEQAK